MIGVVEVFISDVLSRNGLADAEERAMRKMMLSMACCIIVGCTGIMIKELTLNDHIPKAYPVVLLLIGAFAVAVAILLKTSKLHKGCFTAWLSLTMVAIACADLYNRSSPPNLEVWPTFIVVIDAAYLFGLSHRAVRGLTCFGCVYLVCVGAETVLRFGLFDVPYLTPPSAVRYDIIEAIMECNDLPCPRNHTAQALVQLCMFAATTSCTRIFANKIECEKVGMQHTIDAIQRITSCLAVYDVDKVAALLTECQANLPDEMHTTLCNLESNLRSYRSYLPEALFQEAAAPTRADHAIPAPGVSIEPEGESEATILFTDIRASTSIWEQAPDAMKKSLILHNVILRTVCYENGGYEVKTVGDAFMIAFDGVAEAVNCGLAMQVALFDTEWPSALLDVPICKADRHWNGLTIRVGVNTGPVSFVTSELTNRVDYFGHTVNVAARLENTCPPGAVRLLNQMYKIVRPCVTTAHSASAVEEIHLRGVEQTAEVATLYPLSLEGRRAAPLSQRDEKNLMAVVMIEREESTSSPYGRAITAERSFDDRTRRASLRAHNACVAAVHLDTGISRGANVTTAFNKSLYDCVRCLERTNGNMVTLVGTCAVIGWNLAKPNDAPTESAFRFTRLLQRYQNTLRASGLCTGTVFYGDVGTAQQRFLTVVGDAVHTAWTLCDAALMEGVMCLYAIPEGVVKGRLLDELLEYPVSVGPGVGCVYSLAEVDADPGSGGDTWSECMSQGSAIFVMEQFHKTPILRKVASDRSLDRSPHSYGSGGSSPRVQDNST